MNYYEELGLERTASEAAIHDAYRRLCRLLHPDRHTADPALHLLAECQMRRLNEVHGTLTDPARRAAYDERLRLRDEAPPRPALWAPLAEPRAWLPATVWGLAACIGLVLMIWLVPDGPVAEIHYVAPVAPEPHSKPQPPPMRTRSRKVEPVQMAAVVPEPDPLPVVEPPRPPVPDPGPQPARSVATEPPAARDPLRPPDSLTGTWFYPKPDQPSGSSLYPPEFIEAVIVEDAGGLRGRYRARYRVGDRAISPNVAFHFAGPPGGSERTYPWTGRGGSHGELSLTLLPHSRLEVVWSVADLGHEMGLASGRAILVRRP